MNILYVCTHNRCRSILCEALTNHLSRGRITAYSAGSQPAGEVHPETLKHLARRGVATSALYSKSWNVFETVPLDAVITVCDSAAGESCPLWMGDAVRAHWGLEDPSRVVGSPDVVDAAFDKLIARIEKHIHGLLDASLATLEGEALRSALNSIAKGDV